MMSTLELATENDLDLIWDIIKNAILRRRKEGSNQWQDGYPNRESIRQDIARSEGYIFRLQNEIIAYAAVIRNNEPAYESIVGKWLSNQDFMVVHRVAVSEEYLGKGWVKKMFLAIENLALSKEIFSIKVDTNFDNLAMLHILKTLNYEYCGKVYFRGSERLAFEKLLS